jgi:glycosyltransferase involved in cell wall biosynthesis
MDLIDFSKNKNSITKHKNIESVLLWGNPDIIFNAKITICIPTYKRSALLREAMKSALSQTTNIPYRVIVVDNDPDFDNMEILDLVRSFDQDKLSYYKNRENLEIFGNLNRCIVLAKTRWVALLHDDDLLVEDYVEYISIVLQKYGKKINGFCVGQTVVNYSYVTVAKKKCIRKLLSCVYKDIKKLLPEIIKIPITANLFLGNVYNPPTCGVVFNKRYFIMSGGFNQDYFPSSDWFFFSYFAKMFAFLKIKKNLGIYRWIDNTSMKESVKEATGEQRKQYILSLINQNTICRVLFYILKKDFLKVMNSRMEVSAKTSIIFNGIRLLYAIYLN